MKKKEQKSIVNKLRSLIKEQLLKEFFTPEKEENLDEISADLFKSALNVSKERGTDRRTAKLGSTFFHKFIGMPLLGGKISNIETHNPNQGNYRNIQIEIEHTFANAPVVPDGLKHDYVYYDIDKDLYGITEPIERKDAVILSKIALQINPDSRYKETGKHFQIKGMNENLSEEFVGGINYDNILASELKKIIGDINKITPYVLELGNKIESDSTGKIHVYDDGKKVKIFNNINEFLKGIRYGVVKLSEDNLSEGHGEKILGDALKFAKKEMGCSVEDITKGYRVCPPKDVYPECFTAHRGGDRHVFDLFRFLAKAFGVSKHFLEQAVKANQSFEWVKKKSIQKVDIISEIESSKRKTLKDIAEENNITPSLPNGKYSFKDFDEFVKVAHKEELYDLALIIANMMLGKMIGMTWNDLPDVNSLWDVIDNDFQSTEELAKAVKEACKERMEDL